MIGTYSTMKINEDVVYFNPKQLSYLYCCEEIPSLSNISDMQVEDLLDEGTPQIYTLCGRGSRSSLRILKQGLSVNEIASSPLPAKPLAIWTVKSDPNDKFDKYVIISFQNASLVLSIEDTVKEVTDSGFDLKKPCLHVGSLINNTFIQVLPNGIIHIKSDKKRAFYQTSSKILAATSNCKQIAAALLDREIIYFEAHGDKLEKVETKVLDAEILSVHIGDIPEGRSRNKFLAVGLADNTIRILSLDVDQCLTKVSTQLLPAAPESIILTELGGNSSEKDLFVFVGLKNGVLMKTSVDSLTGAMSDTRNKYLGSKSISLYKTTVQGQPAVIANSNKSWICYNTNNKYFCTMLNYDTIECAASLISPQCNEGIVAISGYNFTIITINRFGEIFTQNVVPLRYTPRKMLIHQENNHIVILESEQNSMTKVEKDAFKKRIAEQTGDDEYLNLNEEQIGVPYAGEGKWASCIRILDPSDSFNQLDLIEFEANEAAFSACIMSFSSTPGETFLIVGTAKDMTLHPRSFSSANILVFAFKDCGKKIEFLHRVLFFNI
jgi:splicing factor 3B subunit 3